MSYSKFKNVPTVLDGIRFASKAEARRYVELKQLERAGKISQLTLQPEFKCDIDGKHICTYRADFAYFTPQSAETRGEYVVEDVKGMRTPVYRIKRRLVEALHRLLITEISK